MNSIATLAFLLLIQGASPSVLDRIKALNDGAAGRVVAADRPGTRRELDELLARVDASVHSDRQRPEQRHVQYDQEALATGVRAGRIFGTVTGDRTYARRFIARQRRLAGTELLNQRRYRQALVPLKAALREADALEDRWLQTITHVNLAYGYLELGSGKQALAECEAAAGAAKTLDAKAQGLTFFNLGSVYLHLGDAARSLEYSEKAVPLSQKAGIKLWEGNSLLNIGAAHLQLGAVDRSREAFERARDVLEKTSDRLGLGRAWYNLSLVALRQERLEDTAAYMEKALPIIREVDIRHSHEIEATKELYANPVELSALQILADTYRKLGQIDRAEAYMKQLSVAKARKPAGHSHG